MEKVTYDEVSALIKEARFVLAEQRPAPESGLPLPLDTVFDVWIRTDARKQLIIYVHPNTQMLALASKRTNYFGQGARMNFNEYVEHYNAYKQKLTFSSPCVIPKEGA